MFSSEQYRAKAAEYLELAAKAESPNEIREFGDLERSYTELANNEEWLEHNFDKMVHAPDKDRLEGDALPAEEDLGPPRGGGYRGTEVELVRTAGVCTLIQNTP